MMGDKEVYKALLKVQSEITNPPNTAVNPFFKSKYAPLPEILKQVRPILNKYGLVLIQNTGSDISGLPFVQTILLDAEDGGTIESERLILQPEKKTVQGIGSAITYGRRYQLSALLGISSEDDNDGNGKTEPSSPPRKSEQPRKQPKPTGKSQPKVGKKQSKKKPQPSKTKNKTNTTSDEPETMDMSPVEVDKLRGIHSELDIWINTVEDTDVTIKEVLIQAQNMLGDNIIELKDFREVKKQLGINAK